MARAKSSGTEDGASSTTPLPPALQSLIGYDLVLQSLVQVGLPLTVESYLECGFNEGVPEESLEELRPVLDALREYEAMQRKT
jgi:hypothetical protein